MDDFSVEESRQILENLKRQSEGWFHMQWDLKDTQSCRQNKDVSQLKNDLDHSQVVFGLLTTHFKLVYGSKSVLSDQVRRQISELGKFTWCGFFSGRSLRQSYFPLHDLSLISLTHWHIDSAIRKIKFHDPAPAPYLPPLINNTISPFNFPSLAHSRPSSRFGLDSYL